MLLILASQRIEAIMRLSGTYEDSCPDKKALKNERRGPPPTIIEWMIILWVFGLIWVEVKQVRFTSGVFF